MVLNWEFEGLRTVGRSSMHVSLENELRSKGSHVDADEHAGLTRGL